MKTIITTLPIYDSIAKQAYERSKHAIQGGIYPIVTPRHRLPAFQWKDGTDEVTAINRIDLVDISGNLEEITSYFVNLPSAHAITGDVYWQYKGETLLYLLDPGIYYLKISADNGAGGLYYYYSEWFQVTCVYENLIAGWTHDGYDPWSVLGTEILSAVSTGAGAHTAESTEEFYMSKGESIKVVTAFTQGYDALPTIYLAYSNTVSLDNNGTASVPFLNEITLTATQSGMTKIYLHTTGQTNFTMSEIFVYREYSSKYLVIDFYNSCDFGDILYHNGFIQTLWFESETMEPSFPLEEEGQKNGEGRFVRTFARQVKKYSARTKIMPDFMVDVFNRMKLHSAIELTDTVGDIHDLYNLDVEHEWLFDDKYYAKIDLVFDYDESVIISSCCVNLT